MELSTITSGYVNTLLNNAIHDIKANDPKGCAATVEKELGKCFGSKSHMITFY
ncbi:hypothetical protein [Sulfolobus sp. S-194]|uniref:hypothetical protein n=1 Tax=Sulfolobus sp. S-194 TaxID=2512240 RepID=UPI00143C6151|nr:hypothetical protein [Sulfolobus sp. S-194]